MKVILQLDIDSGLKNVIHAELYDDLPAWLFCDKCVPLTIANFKGKPLKVSFEICSFDLKSKVARLSNTHRIQLESFLKLDQVDELNAALESHGWTVNIDKEWYEQRVFMDAQKVDFSGIEKKLIRHV
jgi:hypothetical protein